MTHSAGHTPLTPSTPPIIVLGVSRSGTGLLKEMLDHHSAIAIPSESHFLAALWNRYPGRADARALFDDLRSLRRVRDWGVDLDEVQRRVPHAGGLPEVMQGVYRSYAEARGKTRFGDRTPGHLRHLERFEVTFPGAQYVHIVRDGRDAARSYQQMAHRPRLTLSQPCGPGDFACCWCLEVNGARRFGRNLGPARYFELRYEDLVREPAARLAEVCAYLGVPFEEGMLEFHRSFRARPRSNHRRLAEPATPGLRDWRTEMRASDIERFEAVAGALLDAFGYERRFARPSRRARLGARLAFAVTRTRLTALRLVMPAFHRSRWWLRRERLHQAAPRRTRSERHPHP